MNTSTSTIDAGQRSEKEFDLNLDFEQQHSGDLIDSRFLLCKPIGKGGMGAVWLAEQSSPIKRTVAIKFLRSEMRTPRSEARFAREHQALAMMNHSHIAQVYDGGETEQGIPFLVMEFVNGPPITEYCDQNRLSIHDRLKLLVKVCTAVEHAHQRGIIHRDLKPNNVLIGEGPEGPAPKVIDFGLAKTLPWSVSEILPEANTIPGIAVGTPSYMAPEQVAARGSDIDTRTDVYAMGVLLFELLTGDVPYGSPNNESGSWLETFHQILHAEPPRPSRRIVAAKDRIAIAGARMTSPRELARSLRTELDWIVLKAIEKRPELRYDSVGAFRRDLHRVIHNQPVDAHPPSLHYQLSKFVRRNSLLTAGVAIVVLAICVGLVGLTLGSIRAHAAEKEARVALANEKKANDRAQRAIAALTDALSSASFSEIDSDAALMAQVVALHEVSETNLEHHGLHGEIAAGRKLGNGGRIENTRSTLGILEHLDRERPNPAYRSVMANVRYHLARLLEQAGHRSEAESEYRLSLAQLQELATDSRSNQRYTYRIAATCEALGTLLISADQQREGGELLREAVRLRR